MNPNWQFVVIEAAIQLYVAEVAKTFGRSTLTAQSLGDFGYKGVSGGRLLNTAAWNQTSDAKCNTCECRFISTLEIYL